MYIERVLCVILIFKTNVKFFHPNKAYLGFIERKTNKQKNTKVLARERDPQADLRVTLMGG